MTGRALINLTPSGVERETAKRFHALGQTSAIAPLWYIWEKGADRVVVGNITSQDAAEQIAASMNRHAAPSRETFFSYERPVDAMMSGRPSDQALALPSEPPSQGDVEGRARELLADELRNSGWPADAVEEVRNFTGKLIAPIVGPALRAIVKALASKEDGRP